MKILFVNFNIRGLRQLLVVMFLLVSNVSHAQVRDQVEYMRLKGAMGERFDANYEQWLVTAPYANPGMLQMYARRNDPHQIMVKWYGEFAGKYLTSAVLCYTMHPNERLKRAIEYVVSELAKVQDEDGYLGVWPDDQKLTGIAPGGHGKTWDAWSHYHNMLGLYYCYRLMDNEQAKDVLLKAADCLYNHYYVHKNIIDEDKDGTDAAIGHIFALLYQMTNDSRHLDMVHLTLSTFESQQGGDYYRAGLDNIPFYQMKRRRWECLHAIETIREYARISGLSSYEQSFANIWRSVQQYDRHNTGGFSSGEAACGNPYDTRAIETCCTIAWMTLSVDMLEMTNDSRIADELELSTWNGFLGAQHPSGRFSTYNTPMLGDKKASADDIVFQAIAGSSELNCCSVNAPRGFGMLSQWGMYVAEDVLTVNYYGASETSLRTPTGQVVTIEQTGSYPFGGDINLKLKTKGVKSLRLRIPEWSKHTKVVRNGRVVDNVECGQYLELSNVKATETITINFDMTLHFWYGERNLEGRFSVYSGPILLTLDQRFDIDAYGKDIAIDSATLKFESGTPLDGLYPQPYLVVRAIDDNGRAITLCDFASAGQTGTLYTTWLKEASGGNRKPEAKKWR